jgi:hypothetical protein
MKSIKRIIITTTLLLLPASSLQAFQSSEWIKFTPAGADFSVMVPAQPKEMSPQPVADFTPHVFGLVVDDSVYVICYGDYAPSVHLNPDAELLANRDNFLKGLDGAATGTTKIELDGRKGIEFTGESSDYHFESRVFLVGNRVYQVAVRVKKGTDSANTSRFIRSFAFTDAQTQTHVKP